MIGMGKDEVLFKKYKKEVARLIGDYKEDLFLNHWEVKIIFNKESLTHGDECNVSASCECLVDYFSADINFYKDHYELYQDKDKYRFEHVILHELCHILTEPLFDEAAQSMNKHNQKYLNTIREQSTEKIATIIHRLLIDADQTINDDK